MCPENKTEAADLYDREKAVKQAEALSLNRRLSQ